MLLQLVHPHSAQILIEHTRLPLYANVAHAICILYPTNNTSGPVKRLPDSSKNESSCQTKLTELAERTKNNSWNV